MVFVPVITIGVPVANLLADRNSPFGEWTGAAAFGTLVTAGATLLLDVTILSRRKNRPIPNNFLFILGFFLGWIKGFGTGFAASNILKIPGISIEDDLKRSFTSATLGAFFLPAMSYLSYSSKRLIHSKEFALSRLENLNEIRESDQKIINEVKDRLLSIQKEFLSLAEMQFENRRAKLADFIEEMGRNVIRPLSHEFAKKRKRKTYDFKLILLEGLKLEPNTMSQALPWVVVMFMAFQGAFIFNYSTVAAAFAISISNLLVLAIILILMIRFFTRFKFSLSVNLILSLIFLSFVPALQVLPLHLLGKDSSWGEFIATEVLLIIVFYVSQFSNTHNLAEENSIETANQRYMEEFDLVLRKSSEDVNDEIVRFLHGTLQTKLAASVFRFRNIEDDSFDLESEVRNVLSHFEVETEISKVIIGESLTGRLSEVLAEWQSLIEIELVPLELDVSKISRSQSCNICDFINECLSNALRHGQATKAKIQISDAVNDVLVLVTNNGEPVGAMSRGKTGLGSRIFTRVSNSRWDIKNKDDGSGVRVSALFSR